LDLAIACGLWHFNRGNFQVVGGKQAKIKDINNIVPVEIGHGIVTGLALTFAVRSSQNAEILDVNQVIIVGVPF
jgi:hypothetical protein